MQIANLELHTSSGPASLRQRLLLPKVDGFGGVGFEWEQYFAAGAGGLVGGEDDFEDCSGIFAGDERLFIIFYAINEVSHFLNEAIIPDFLVDGEGPAHGRTGFLDRVVVADAAV